QLVTGLREIEEAIGCNRRTVIKWLQYLEDTQRITRERSPRGSVITDLNYKKYQDIREKGTQLSAPLDAPLDTPLSAQLDAHLLNQVTINQENIHVRSQSSRT